MTPSVFSKAKELKNQLKYERHTKESAEASSIFIVTRKKYSCIAMVEGYFNFIIVIWFS